MATSLNIRDAHADTIAVIGEAECAEQHSPFRDPASSMVISDMTMVPGAWEPRRQPTTIDAPVSTDVAPAAASRGAAPIAPAAPRRELPGWLQVTIFAATLLAATWLAMMMFFEKAK